MPAAIFDLDRTMIPGSVVPVFSRMLLDIGVAVPQPPGRTLAYSLFRRLGEDPVTVRLAAHAARLFADQPVGRVEAAGRLAADVLASRIVPGARAALERHNEAGDRLVLATSAPDSLARPFAELVGMDHVISTVYRHRDGVYDGTNESSFVWGSTKARLVAAWAASQDVDLTESWAYSDSIYDADLLQMVGYPVAINADLRLSRLARRSGWPRRRWPDAT